MTLTEYLEKRERGLERNKIANWIDRLIFAQMARGEWDKQVVICNKIRSNQIPIMDSGSDLPEFTDKYYRDNWIMKSNVWKESHLQAADVMIELRTRASADDIDQNREFLEMEINYTMDEFDMVRDTPDVISDRTWYGYGLSYMPWNAMRANKNWKTGVPDFRYHPAQAFWVDESANQSGWKNRRWEFAKFALDIDEAKELYPEFADKIVEVLANSDHADSEHKRDIFDVYLCQYRTNVRVDMVDVTWTEAGQEKSEQVYYREVEDFMNSVSDEQRLPDNIFIGDRYTIEKECWFQFFFSPDISERLTEIEYIGDRDFFQIFWGLKLGNSLYPTSWTYLLADILDIKTVAMTLAAVQAIKNGNPMPIVEQGAIRNMQEFRESRNSLDYVAEISEEWRRMHPGEKPISYAEGRFDPNVMLMLNNYITDAIKTSTGTVDAARGEAQYSGQSGVQTAQLQSAAAIYTKQDEFCFRDYLRQIAELLLQYIGEFRTYEHKLNGINDQGQDETMMINEGNVTTWNWEEYYAVPIIENTPEVMKQMKRQEAVQLRQSGSISNLDMLRMLDYPNAMQLEQNRINENQIMQLAQFLSENPDIANAVLSGVSGGGQGEGEDQAKKTA
jgi:hypothetical protein